MTLLTSLSEMLDDIFHALKWLVYGALAVLVAIGLAFAIAHTAETWDAPEYPYTGFTPDCPEWSPCEEYARNTLPPTEE